VREGQAHTTNKNVKNDQKSRDLQPRRSLTKGHDNWASGPDTGAQRSV
jgi:hypothetical protein